MTRWSPMLAPLAEWLGSTELAARDASLSEDRTALCCAEELVRDTVAGRRPAADGPAAAVELELLARQLSAAADTERTLLRRAAALCAGEEWDRLAAVLPALRNRIGRTSEALADVAVRASRLQRDTPPGLALAPSPAEQAFDAEAEAIDDELRRRIARAGARSAYAAADDTFLPSLADFLT